MAKLSPDRVRTSGNDDGGPGASPPPEWWGAVLADPRAVQATWIPIQKRRLSAIQCELLRVECLKCSRCVEIRRLDAIKLYGPDTLWRDVGEVLLDRGCQHRTGNRDEDGCWPNWQP
jgi:hypothetical protein